MKADDDRETYNALLFLAVLLYIMLNLACVFVIRPIPIFDVLKFFIFVGPGLFSCIVLGLQIAARPFWWLAVGLALAAMVGAVTMNLQFIYQAAAAV